MEPRDIYIQVTDKNGSTHIQERRVWNAERFFDSVRAQYKKEGATVSMSTRDAYVRQRDSVRSAA